MQAPAGFKVVPVAPAQLSNPLLRSADAVVVCDAPQMPSVQYEALARYAGSGGNLVWFLCGERIADQTAELGRHLPAAEPIPLSVERVAELNGNGKGYVTLAEARYESPLLKAFKDPAAAALSKSRFRRFCVTGEVDRRAEVLLKFEDGTAAAVRSGVGSGSLLLVNMSPSPDWSDLARQEVFLPLMHEFLKGLLLKEADVRESIAGGAASTTIPPVPGGAKPHVVCTGPQGNVAVTVEPTTGAVVIDQAKRCGFYRLTAAGANVATVPVNMHADETDLRAIDPRELETQRQKEASFLTGPAGSSASPEDLSRGRPLWPYLLTLTLLLLFAEQLLARVRPRMRTAAR